MTAAKPSFFRRELPDLCISLSSAEGKRLFSEALVDGRAEACFPLLEQFTTQSEPAYCGLASLTMILNALGVDPGRVWKGPWRWYHEDMLDCCEPLDVIKKRGVPMEKLARLARCNGLAVDMKRGNEMNPAAFRSLVDGVCEQKGRKGQYLILGYSRKVLGQTGDGHFSPIAAYHRADDMVLILDTARFKYPPHWVKMGTLVEAMNTIDKDTGRYRGYLLLCSPSQMLPACYPAEVREGEEEKRGVKRGGCCGRGCDEGESIPAAGGDTRSGGGKEATLAPLSSALFSIEYREGVAKEIRSLLRDSGEVGEGRECCAGSDGSSNGSSKGGGAAACCPPSTSTQPSLPTVCECDGDVEAVVECYDRVVRTHFRTALVSMSGRIASLVQPTLLFPSSSPPPPPPPAGSGGSGGGDDDNGREREEEEGKGKVTGGGGDEPHPKRARTEGEGQSSSVSEVGSQTPAGGRVREEREGGVSDAAVAELISSLRRDTVYQILERKGKERREAEVGQQAHASESGGNSEGSKGSESSGANHAGDLLQFEVGAETVLFYALVYLSRLDRSEVVRVKNLCTSLAGVSTADLAPAVCREAKYVCHQVEALLLEEEAR